MLDRLRASLDSYLGTLGRGFARVSPNPISWTFVGFGIALLAAVSFAGRGNLAEVFGGVFVLVSGFFDLVDGAVARVTGRASKKGAFLDSTLDRVAEIGIFVGIAVGRHADPILVILALSASLLVSYTRAKGDSLGIALSGVGIGERSERLLILAVSSLIVRTDWGVLLVIAVALFTFVERTLRAVAKLA